MNKPLVRLYDSVGTGLIIEFPTGIEYSNQACGTSCLQPALEGAFIPIANDVAVPDNTLISIENELRHHFESPKYAGTGAPLGLDEEDADFIDRLLASARLGDQIKVDRAALAESCEAWVFVKIVCDGQSGETSIFRGFEPYPRRGVLTWTNSD